MKTRRCSHSPRPGPRPLGANRGGGARTRLPNAWAGQACQGSQPGVRGWLGQVLTSATGVLASPTPGGEEVDSGRGHGCQVRPSRWAALGLPPAYSHARAHAHAHSACLARRRGCSPSPRGSPLLLPGYEEVSCQGPLCSSARAPCGQRRVSPSDTQQRFAAWREGG